MKILIVGLGSMGKRRIRNLQRLGLTGLVGVDPREDRRAEAHAKYGVETAPALTDELTRGAGALVISTPPDAHLPPMLVAARAGRPFFVEAGVSAEGFDEVARLCRERGVVAAPSCTMRHHPSVRTVHRLVESGVAGRPLTFQHHCGQWLPDWHPWEDYRAFYVSRRVTGACREIVPFELTWLTHTFGPVLRVSAQKAKLTRLEADIDDLYQLQLEFASGVHGQLQVDVIARQPYRQFKLLSEEAVVTWDSTTKTVACWTAAKQAWETHVEPAGTVEQGYVNAEDMYVDEMRAFLDAVAGRAPWPNSLADDAACLAVLEAAEESAATGRRVELAAAPAPRTGDLTRSTALAERARRLIPAGCHTYSKGPDQFPSNAPGVIERGAGCRVWDADGNRYLDWGMGLRSVILGHAHPAVLAAVRAQLERGANFTRPSPVEGELAELLCELIPCAEMVKLAKNGSDVTSAAVRLARAYTGRDLVATCRENPFYSFEDWFIGSTVCDAGIPAAVRALTVQYGYNDLESLAQLFAAHPGRIACVILEPVSLTAPAPGFLEGVKRLAHEHGAVLVFDEMISGFRWHLSGAQAHFGVTPDLATFGKGMGNGFSTAALVGRREIMELGGLEHAKPRVFLLSATHGGETHAIAAALATVRELAARDGVAHLWRVGGQLVEGFNALATAKGLAAHAEARGYPCSPYLVFRGADGRPSAPLRTLFLQEMVARGVLIPYLAPAVAHGPAEVEETLAACAAAFEKLGLALERGFAGLLEGPAVKPVFRRFNAE